MSSRDALRRQRRRELDARRSKSRVRLGACLHTWGQLKEKLGFTLHSELAQYLLQSYFSKVCVKCSGNMREVDGAEALVMSADSLQRLVLLVHQHGQRCPFPPTLQPHPADRDQAACAGQAAKQEDGQSGTGQRGPSGCKKGRWSEVSGQASVLPKEEGRVPCVGNVKQWTCEVPETSLGLRYTCKEGHRLSWSPSEKGNTEAEGSRSGVTEEQSPPCVLSASREPEQRETQRISDGNSGVECSVVKTTRGRDTSLPVRRARGEQLAEEVVSLKSTETEHNRTEERPGQDTASDVIQPESVHSREMLCTLGEDFILKDKNCSQTLKNDSSAVLQRTTRGKQRAIQGSVHKVNSRAVQRTNRRTAKGKSDDDMSQISGKRKRKAIPRDILPCEFDGCGKIFSTRQYLNHHMKYQHFQQKTFSCSHPACGKSFNFKKHLKEHEKLHSNQRDYICEFCARAFRTSSNLLIHRRIHTGEKPLQCEVCGFTCRQKASLNWHMRKHNAESGYQFPCDICGRRFEKRDNVTAHRSKSHPDQAHSPTPVPDHVASGSESPSPGATPLSLHRVY